MLDDDVTENVVEAVVGLGEVSWEDGPPPLVLSILKSWKDGWSIAAGERRADFSGILLCCELDVEGRLFVLADVLLSSAFESKDEAEVDGESMVQAGQEGEGVK